MLELPESLVISGQVSAALRGKRVTTARANESPHKFAWFFGDPEGYPALLKGRRIGGAKQAGGQIEIAAEGATILIGEGAAPRLYAPGTPPPAKRQLYIEFDDGSALVCTVQMYGGLFAYPDGMNENPYYLVTQQKPSPYTEAFDAAYFERLFSEAKPSLSAKAFLATEQRIPGLGNGVLQDILFLSGIHPARAIRTLPDGAAETLFHTVKGTLRTMAGAGGRDTEKDLFGAPGGYKTLLSSKTWAFPCPRCGGAITRKAYLGGNVYFCAACQPVA